MPIVESSISSEIQALIAGNKETDPEAGIKKYADGMAKVIANAIKSAQIIVPMGIPVATAGSPTAQTGATTAPSQPAIIS